MKYRDTYCLLILLPVLLSAGCQSPAPERFGFGRTVSPQEIAAWDIDVKPDGTGLPPGQGTVAAGETLYRAQCQVCHGEEGRNGINDQLVSAFNPDVNFSLGQDRKTIGSYWPYATTLYDYIQRAMPHTAPGSLNPDQVYALTAYLLNLNGIIPAEAVMDANTLPAVEMPARTLFYWSDEVQ